MPRDVEDLTCEELCEVTELPAGTVKSRLHRARGVLNMAVLRELGETRPQPVRPAN